MLHSLFDYMEVLIIANFKKDDLPINEKIRVRELMVIGPNGEQMGTKDIKDALTLAEYAGLDLVLMNESSTFWILHIRFHYIEFLLQKYFLVF